MAKIISTAPATMTAKETQILGRDIIYLKPMPKQWKAKAAPMSSFINRFYALLGLPALLLLFIAFFSIRRDSLAGNVAKARRQKAPKSARKQIQLAEQAIHKKEVSAFYEALWNALAEYFGNRLNLAPGEVSLSAVLNRITGDHEDEKSALRDLFEKIDHHRYGSGGSVDKSEMKTMLKNVNSILKTCERLKL